MPIFQRRKTESGTYEMVPIPVEDPQHVDLTGTPPATTLKSPAKKRFECALCDARFAGTGIFSMHFAKQHKDKVADKNSWRQYVRALDDNSSK